MHLPDGRGSMLFVDISGFTKMSERLARHGKVGAEEVTDVLGAIFARLLAVAYGEDGSLLKFGGDALLVWFTGEHHAARAAWSAHNMRDAPQHRPSRDHGREGRPTDVLGRAQRVLPFLPRRRLAPRADRHRPGGEPNRGDGGDRHGGEILVSHDTAAACR